MDKGIAISDRTIYIPPTDTWAWLEVICTKPATYLDVWGETCQNRFERVVTHPFHVLMRDGTVLTAEAGDRVANYDECKLSFGTVTKILRTHLLDGLLSEDERDRIDESAIDILASGRECISVPISPSDLPRDMKTSVKRDDILGVFCDMPGMRDEQFEFLILSRWFVREDILAANGIEITDGVATATAAER